MNRIKQHWKRSDYFQMGIGRFKAMDTTRIFVYPINNIDAINEAKYRCVPDFPERYTLNCGNSGGDVWFQKTNAPLKLVVYQAEQYLMRLERKRHLEVSDGNIINRI